MAKYRFKVPKEIHKLVEANVETRRMRESVRKEVLSAIEFAPWNTDTAEVLEGIAAQIRQDLERKALAHRKKFGVSP